MNYQRLIAEHEAIDAAASVVVYLSEHPSSTTAEVTRALETLAKLLREHLDGEDETIYSTIVRAQDGRHAAVADRMGVEFDRLKDAWENYLYRWDAEHIEANWPGFAQETADMLGRISERVAFETMVLYSLAVHLEVIPAS